MSLTQNRLTDLEVDDCFHPQAGVCGILSGMISTDNLVPKKDSSLPFSLILLVLLISNAMRRRILHFIPPESRCFYKNPILFKLSKVRLLI